MTQKYGFAPNVVFSLENYLYRFRVIIIETEGLHTKKVLVVGIIILFLSTIMTTVVGNIINQMPSDDNDIRNHEGMLSEYGNQSVAIPVYDDEPYQCLSKPTITINPERSDSGTGGEISINDPAFAGYDNSISSLEGSCSAWIKTHDLKIHNARSWFWHERTWTSTITGNYGVYLYYDYDGYMQYLTFPFLGFKGMWFIGGLAYSVAGNSGGRVLCNFPFVYLPLRINVNENDAVFYLHNVSFVKGQDYVFRTKLIVEGYSTPSLLFHAKGEILLNGRNEKIIIGNNKPDKPFKPIGPTMGNPEKPYFFTFKGKDADNDYLNFEISWGDGNKTTDYWSPSGDPLTCSHVWERYGTYDVKVRTKDSQGAFSSWSESASILIDTIFRPSPPEFDDAPNEAFIGFPSDFTVHSTDIDDDLIQYGWDWDGDDLVDEWTEFFPSNEPVTISHIWNEAGTHKVKVKARDTTDLESVWSDSLTVQIKEPPNLIVSGISNGLFRLYTDIYNDAETDAHDVYWSINFTQGSFVKTTDISGYCNISGKQKFTIETEPLFGIGRVSVCITVRHPASSTEEIFDIFLLGCILTPL